jgi:hypothetical protein
MEGEPASLSRAPGPDGSSNRDRRFRFRLKNEFYTKLPGIKDGIFGRLLTHGFYRARPDKVAGGWAAGAIGVGFLIAFGGAFVAAKFSLTAVPFIVAGVLSTIILMAFAAVMPARTEAGARALEKVKGFEEFLRRVESPQYAHVKKTPELFDRCLPYAMAFGVEAKWAKAFEGIYREPPRWYVGPGYGHFSVTNFSGRMASFTSSRNADVLGAAKLERVRLQRRLIGWWWRWGRRGRILAPSDGRAV